MNEIDNYEPYGHEWEVEMKKLPKDVMIRMIRKANLKIQSLSNVSPYISHYSSVDQLTSLQAELGYKEGELSTVAILGLVGEAGEVLSEADLNNFKGEDTMYGLDNVKSVCKWVDDLKKEVRKGDNILEYVFYEPTKEAFKAELADCFYYLNILATNVNLTVFDLAQMAHDKIRRKQAEGGSSEDRKS